MKVFLEIEGGVCLVMSVVSTEVGCHDDLCKICGLLGEIFQLHQGFLIFT